MKTNDVFWTFGEIGAAQREAVGAKAASLARMQRLGFRVPQGFVIDNRHFLSFVGAAGLHSKVELLQKILCTIRVEHIQKLSAEILRGLDAVPFPAQLETALAESLAPSGLGAGPLVCRSSSSLEDSEDLAFPGVFLTVFDIRDLAGLKKAIVDCYCSLFDMRALKYLMATKPKQWTFGMALVVQRQIDGDISGVLFSREPDDDHGDAMVVEAIAGRGDSLVWGGREPYRYRCHADRGWELVHAPPANSLRTVEPHGLLDAAKLGRLAEICRELKQEAGRDVDIEFTFLENETEPYLFQCRPITAAARGASGRGRFEEEAVEVHHGITCSSGSAWGVGFDGTRLCGDPEELNGKILLIESLTLANYDAIYSCRGVVSEKHDSQLNHVSIACREIGLPYIAGIEHARQKFHGVPLELDGASGAVSVLRHAGSVGPEDARASAAETLIGQIAYWPLLKYLPVEGTERLRFTGIVYLIARAMQRATSRDGVERFLVGELDGYLANCPGIRLRIELPRFSAQELAVLSECLPDLQLTGETVSEWIRALTDRLQHKERLEWF